MMQSAYANVNTFRLHAINGVMRGFDEYLAEPATRKRISYDHGYKSLRLA